MDLVKSCIGTHCAMDLTSRENIGKGMGLEGGGFGGEGALESSKVELLRKILLKAKHF